MRSTRRGSARCRPDRPDRKPSAWLLGPLAADGHAAAALWPVAFLPIDCTAGAEPETVHIFLDRRRRRWSHSQGRSRAPREGLVAEAQTGDTTEIDPDDRLRAFIVTVAGHADAECQA